MSDFPRLIDLSPKRILQAADGVPYFARGLVGPAFGLGRRILDNNF
jgi:hypothetical protein